MQVEKPLSEVKTGIFRMISEELVIPAEQLTLATDFKKDLEVDSLRVIEFALLIEERFGVTIPDDRMDAFRTIGDVVAFVEGNRASPEQQPTG